MSGDTRGRGRPRSGRAGAPAPLISAPTHRDARGALSVLTAGVELPFAFDRCFWVHGVPSGVTRGGHAHRSQHQAIFCASGRLSVLVADRAGERTIILDRAEQVLHLPPLSWAEETPLGDGTVWVVLASGRYDPADYLKTRDDWEAERRKAEGGRRKIC